MLKRLLSTTALSLVPFAAGAADLPLKAPVYKAPLAAPYNWTGFYAGANIGYSWGRSEVTYDTFLGASAERLHPNGVIGGFQVGYNRQLSRNWVAGLETDFQWTGQKKSVSRTTDVDLVNVLVPDDELIGTTTAAVKSKLTWMGTARGKIGFVPDSNPELMLYGTGGLAYGRVKTSFVGSATGTYTDPAVCNGEGPACTFSAALSYGDGKVKVGWTLGAGIEAALAQGWTWKIEYLYVDLGTASGTVPITGTVCTDVCSPFSGTATYSNKMTDNIVRIGLNRRFGGP